MFFFVRPDPWGFMIWYNFLQVQWNHKKMSNVKKHITSQIKTAAIRDRMWMIWTLCVFLLRVKPTRCCSILDRHINLEKGFLFLRFLPRFSVFNTVKHHIDMKPIFKRRFEEQEQLPLVKKCEPSGGPWIRSRNESQPKQNLSRIGFQGTVHMYLRLFADSHPRKA